MTELNPEVEDEGLGLEEDFGTYLKDNIVPALLSKKSLYDIVGEIQVDWPEYVPASDVDVSAFKALLVDIMGAKTEVASAHSRIGLVGDVQTPELDRLIQRVEVLHYILVGL